MKPPVAFWDYVDPDDTGWSRCFGCDKWRKNINFYNNQHWILCYQCWEDYWFNEDELAEDYKPPIKYGKFKLPVIR